MKDFNQSSNTIMTMNKAKAYRELQKRQSKIQKLWSATTNTVPSLDSNHISLRTSNVLCTKNASDTNCHKDHIPDMRRFRSHMLSLNKTTESLKLRSQVKYSRFYDSSRPVTAPETDAFASLDSAKKEDLSKPPFKRALSISDLGSLNDYTTKNTRNTHLHKSLDLSARSVGINENDSLAKEKNNEDNDTVIQYPSASRMREMLANDGLIITPAASGAEKTHPVLAKRSSLLSLSSRSNMSITLKKAVTSPTSLHPDSHVNVVNPLNKINGTETVQILPLKSQNKQVSFEPEGPPEGGSQPLTLTAKNLDMYNAMILRTMRTSKFDERIIKWVKERQVDEKLKIPHHESIPEIEESIYHEKITLHNSAKLTGSPVSSKLPVTEISKQPNNEKNLKKGVIIGTNEPMRLEKKASSADCKIDSSKDDAIVQESKT